MMWCGRPGSADCRRSKCGDVGAVVMLESAKRESSEAMDALFELVRDAESEREGS